ncbi:hypothetical protein [Streptomyces griseicoloratus]|nr:hypothetical protein [Streptomyces griseicoloratus]
MSRSSAITAGVAAAAALTATGITYATAAPEPQAAPAVVQQAPVQAPTGGDTGNNNDDNNDDKKGNGHRGGKHGDHEGGWIHINERSYSAHSSGCVVVASGLGSRSLNIRNDSKKTIEVFRGLTCDNGAPIATVGPHSTAHGVVPGQTHGVVVPNGVIGSFRVIDHGDNGKGDH